MLKALRPALIGLLLALLPFGAFAQQASNAAILVADDVYLQGDEVLIAEGNVEVLYDGVRLQAAMITYDRRAEKLDITGPITLRDGERITILADAAELDRDLKNGLLTGARMVMDDQLQLAAYQLNRVNGRYSQLYKASVTSCRICETGQPPLWQIRARRVIHDQKNRQLYFEEAQFQILDVPVFYLPRLRLPDPSLKRATGFLIPSIRNSTLLGTGIKVPYFIRIGDHKDLTLTPYLSSETRTLEFRYRQAFVTGDISFTGAVSQDSLRDNGSRAYLFGGGAFDLKRGFKLTFDIEAVSDDTYLVDYGYSDKDRLDSEVAVERTRRDEYLRVALTHFHSLRAGEDNATLPTIVGNMDYERRFFPSRLGGELRLGAAAHSHFRFSDLDTDGIDPDTWADGRDVSRLSASADWRRKWTLAGGARLGLLTGISADAFQIQQGGATSDASAAQVTPSAALQLRWPLAKTNARGVTHIIEPVAQLAWVGGSDLNIPNDESTRSEFDEGNLLSLSRFAAPDRRERGVSAALGVGWTRLSPTGWESSLTLGQVYREKAEQDFTLSSGLREEVSDFLVAGQLKAPNGLALTARGLFDTSFSATKAEARVEWKAKRGSLDATYIWLGADDAEDRANTISEWTLGGSYRMSRHWTGSARWRYDVASDRNVRASVGLKYTNECVDVTLSASRRFTTSTILDPSTDFSFTVGLRGFSTRTQDKSYVRTCRN